MIILTYLSSLIASLVSGGSDDQPNIASLVNEVVVTILTYLSSLIASLVSGGSDDHPNIFK